MILLAPIFLYILISLKIKIDSPIIYKQNRVGLKGRSFVLYKFRTMILNAEQVLDELLERDTDLKKHYYKYRKLSKDPRIIPGIGQFLRKSNLDELPQLFNILKGEMKLIGPRPYLSDELNNIAESQVKIITSIKPGLTGVWQIRGNLNSLFMERIESDIAYAKERTTFLDIRLFFKTVFTVIKRTIH